MANNHHSSSPTLRELIKRHRLKAGLTQQRLAELIGVHPTAIHRWEAGERTPRPEHIVAIATLLKLPEAERDGMLAAGDYPILDVPSGNGIKPQGKGIPPCPYRGLFAFQEADAPYFFGREHTTQQLLGEMRGRPLVGVVGPSGSGKSSVVFAGLVPALRKEGWVITWMRPGRDPVYELAASLVPLLEPNMGEVDRIEEISRLSAGLKEGRLRPHQVLERILAVRPAARGFLLIVDQFEELYTTCDTREARDFFVDLLLESVGLLSQQPGRHYSLVLNIRADFLGHALLHRPLADALQDATLMLGPMNRSELEEAIVRPAQALNVQVESRLAQSILDEVLERPGGLPLLEFTLTLMWEHQRNGALTYDVYERLGGIESTLAEYAEGIIRGLSAPDRERARRIFTQLVQPGENTEDTRRIATYAELGEEDWGLVNRLADTRLIVSARRSGLNGSQEPVETAEIVHEALIKEWQTLRAWIAADREFRLWQERLRSVLRQWQLSYGDPSILLRGSLLSEAEDWLDRRAPDLSREEVDLIHASIFLREREISGRRRLRNRILGGLVAGLAFSLALATVAGMQWSRAEGARQQAEAQQNIALAEAQRAERASLIATARRLAVQSQNLLERHPQRSLLLAIEAMRHAAGISVPSAEEALRKALSYSQGPKWSMLSGHQDQVFDIAFSPDGTWLATASADATLRLWDVTSPDPQDSVIVLPHGEELEGVDFSSDGRWLATGSVDSSVRLWDLRSIGSSQQPILLSGQEEGIRIVPRVSFSPDGTLLAAKSTKGTVSLWDMKSPGDGSAPIALLKYGEEIRAMAISGDNRWLASGGTDGAVVLWDLTTDPPGKESLVLSHHDDYVLDIAFSPDNRWLVTGSRDDTVRLWDLGASGFTSEYIELTAHSGAVLSVVISSDSTTLVTASEDNTARIWDLDSLGPESEPVSLEGHMSSIYGIALSSDDRWLLTGSADGAAILWDLAADPPASESIQLDQHDAGVRDVAISPDGRWLVTGTWDGTVRLWDWKSPDSTREPKVLEGLEGGVNDFALSSEGRWLTAGDDSGTVLLWDMESEDGLPSPIRLRGHDDPVTVVAMSPDDRWLATAGEDQTILLRGVSEGGPATSPVTLSRHQGPITAMAFSPDGRWLVSGSSEGEAFLWNTASPDPGGTFVDLPTHEKKVRAIAFSADNRWMVVASDDVIRLWDLRSGDGFADYTELLGHGSTVKGLTFSPDGRWLATGSSDQSVRLWDLRTIEARAGPIVWEGHHRGLWHMNFSPDSRWLVSGSADYTARLWKLVPLQSEVAPIVLPAHGGAVRHTAFSPDGRWLVTGSDDGIARLWDLSDSHPERAPIRLEGHQHAITDVAFTPDNQRVITSGGDGTIRIWTLDVERLVSTACSNVGRNLTIDEWNQYLEGEPYRKTCPRAG